MANNFGDLTNSEMVHDLVDDLVLDLEPILGLANDFSEETVGGGAVRTARPGQVITVKNWKPNVTVYDVDQAVGYTASDVTLTDGASLTLPTAIKAASMSLTSAEYRELIASVPNSDGYNRLRTRFREEASQKLAEAMVTDFHATITAPNFANNFVTAAGTFTKDSEIDVEAKLFGRKLASRANAQLILPAASTYKEWAKDHLAILTNTGMAQNERVMGKGMQSMVTPFKVWRTNVTMPAAATRGYALTKTSHLFCARIPDEPTYERDPVSLQEVVHPKYKIGFLARAWKDAKKASMQFDLAIIYKFFPLQSEALERLTAV